MGEKKRESVVKLCGMALAKRGFATLIRMQGADGMARFLDNDDSDLTDGEANLIDAVARLPLMRFPLWLWWRMYDLHKAVGAIPNQDPWL